MPFVKTKHIKMRRDIELSMSCLSLLNIQQNVVEVLTCDHRYYDIRDGENSCLYFCAIIDIFEKCLAKIKYL